ncbi:MAG: 4-(cytidine 5'-diphospho)-2-C-methyl-D-erythritol kinase [Schwartzia sp.]|nr:4-(cytidine 5'-diphospho)-2-C-methyl-D-erythritol kinase [Schwartzia sp. (in: firmicutes)]
MITVTANAKINLALDVLGKRKDGYHEVKLVMQSIGLADTIWMEPKPCGIELEVDSPELPADESNLAYKAARLFLDEHSMQHGVSIAVKKKIPMGAGLAGGSADAAAVLLGMDKLFGTRMTQGDFMRMAAKLGSDVPFCVIGGTMLAEGRGECLTELPELPSCWVVLAKPDVSVSTAWAYNAFDDEKDVVHPDIDGLQQALKDGDMQKVLSNIGNVLEPIAVREYPVIGDYLAQMEKHGAQACRMTGSGSAVFGIFKSQVEAESAAAALRGLASEVFAVPVKRKACIIEC